MYVRETPLSDGATVTPADILASKGQQQQRNIYREWKFRDVLPSTGGKINDKAL